LPAKSPEEEWTDFPILPPSGEVQEIPCLLFSEESKVFLKGRDALFAYIVGDFSLPKEFLYKRING